jgi:hypothetical protein
MRTTGCRLAESTWDSWIRGGRYPLILVCWIGPRSPRVSRPEIRSPLLTETVGAEAVAGPEDDPLFAV